MGSGMGGFSSLPPLLYNGAGGLRVSGAGDDPFLVNSLYLSKDDASLQGTCNLLKINNFLK
jgi:hypothetical protein